MRSTINTLAVMAIALTFCPSAHAGSTYRQAAGVPGPMPDLAYTVKNKLWLRSLSSGAAWQVPTPWAATYLSWSPDGTAIAVDSRQGIAVVALHGETGRVVFVRRLQHCCFENAIWSPDGRYVAFRVDTRSVWLENLWLWDRVTGSARLLVRGTSSGYDPTWAHDSTHIAVALGALIPSFGRARNPTADILDVRSGQITHLGKGVPGEWSPDDRFLGFDHLWDCGATGCFVQEGVIPSSGGPVTVLDWHIRRSWLTYEAWTPRPYGYAYDRWLLGPRGHILRRLVPRIPGRLSQVQGWSPDGHWVAAKWLAPSYRIVLMLVNADTGRSRRIYVSAPTGGCDACMNEGYDVTWNHTSTAFAMMSPYLFGSPPKPVNPSLYVYRLNGADTWLRRTRGVPLTGLDPGVLGWVDHDRVIILYRRRVVYRYLPSSQRLIPIVRVSYPHHDFQYGYPPAIALRPAA